MKRPERLPFRKWPPKLAARYKLLQSLKLTDRPVRVEVIAMPLDEWGVCKKLRSHYRISISLQALRRFPVYFCCVTLYHEWAHAAAYPHRREDHHSRRWGVAFARIYRETREHWNAGLRPKARRK